MALTCPGCRSQMEPVDQRGVAVDVCRSCRGLWLDGGELEKLGGVLPPGGVGYGGERRCPRCDAPMRVRPSRVARLDLCSRCCGVYLDAGEIDLVARVHRLDLPAPRPAAPPARPASPGAPAGRPREPTFECEACRRHRKLSEQVVGAKATVCRACARERGIGEDLAARRKAELASRRQTARGAPARPPDPLRVLEGLEGLERWPGRGGGLAGLIKWLLDN